MGRKWLSVITRSRIWARLCLFLIDARQAEALVGLLQGPATTTAVPPALTIGNVNPNDNSSLNPQSANPA